MQLLNSSMLVIYIQGRSERNLADGFRTFHDHAPILPADITIIPNLTRYLPPATCLSCRIPPNNVSSGE
jgi:hypothetical protein